MGGKRRVGRGRKDGENVHNVHANLSAKRTRGRWRNVQNASAKRPTRIGETSILSANRLSAIRLVGETSAPPSAIQEIF